MEASPGDTFHLSRPLPRLYLRSWPQSATCTRRFPRTPRPPIPQDRHKKAAGVKNTDAGERWKLSCLRPARTAPCDQEEVALDLVFIDQSGTASRFPGVLLPEPVPVPIRVVAPGSAAGRRQSPDAAPCAPAEPLRRPP